MKKCEAPKKIFPLGTLIAMKEKEYLLGMILEHEIDSNLHHWYSVECFFKKGNWIEKLTPNEIKLYAKEYKLLKKDLGI
jgi:hypothetical protein